MKQKYEVVVIGSGISGMSAALLFAKDGKKTALVEQSEQIAPLFAGFDRKIECRNIHFETGFHYSYGFGNNEIGSLLLQELGLDIPLESCDKDNYDQVFICDEKKVFKTPIGKEKLKQRLTQLYPQEKAGIEEYFNLISSVTENSPVFKSLEFKDILTLSDDNGTLQDVLDKCFTNEEIKRLLSYQCILHGTPPSKVSFVLHCYCVGLMTDSVWRIKGGAKILVKAFFESLKKYGVDIFTKKKAVKIEVKNTLKKILFEDSSETECDICIASVHPKEFIKIAPEGTYRKKMYERIESLCETPSFFVLYGVLNGTKKYECTNMAFLSKSSQEDFFYGEDISPAYINFSDTTPQNICAVAFVKPDAAFWDRTDKEYKEKKDAAAKKLKEKIALLLPEVASEIKYCDTASPATFKRYLNYYGGYGIMHEINAGQLLPMTKIPGLFLTGQAVVTPGLLGAMISSFLLYKIVKRGNNGERNFN